MSVETPEFGAMVRRMIRAYGRRVADADPEDLAGLAALASELDQAVRAAVHGQRDAGASWADIGRGLGITRQSAQGRFGCQVSPDALLAASA